MLINMAIGTDEGTNQTTSNQYIYTRIVREHGNTFVENTSRENA